MNEINKKVYLKSNKLIETVTRGDKIIKIGLIVADRIFHFNTFTLLTSFFK